MCRPQVWRLVLGSIHRYRNVLYQQYTQYKYRQWPKATIPAQYIASCPQYYRDYRGYHMIRIVIKRLWLLKKTQCLFVILTWFLTIFVEFLVFILTNKNLSTYFLTTYRHFRLLPAYRKARTKMQTASLCRLSDKMQIARKFWKSR